jgi:energy-coupling factor transporter ATP-binding protein EcfA2
MPGFPFSAIVGQDEMKRALLIAAVEPRIGGVMVFGDRGTGKSTAARALASLLPPLPREDGGKGKTRVPLVVGAVWLVLARVRRSIDADHDPGRAPALIV